jgi:hypothetical protein
LEFNGITGVGKDVFPLLYPVGILLFEGNHQGNLDRLQAAAALQLHGASYIAFYQDGVPGVGGLGSHLNLKWIPGLFEEPLTGKLFHQDKLVGGAPVLFS